MEVGLAFLLVLLERNRPDLHLRRRWAALSVPRPALAWAVPVPVALAGLDLRRWCLRLTMLLVGYALYRVFAPALPADTYNGVNGLVGFFLAFIGLGVLALVAVTSGRDRGEEILAALPAGPRSRILGWAALLAVFAAAEYAALLVVRYGQDAPAYVALLPGPWELASGPLMLLGGGLLGLLLARLMPGWVATPVGVVVGVAWVVTFSLNGWGTTMLAPVTEWIQYHEDGRVIVEPGSFAWHNGYLLGLCALGLVTALLVEQGRRKALLFTGLVVLAGTVTAGALALP